MLLEVDEQRRLSPLKLREKILEMNLIFNAAGSEDDLNDFNVDFRENESERMQRNSSEGMDNYVYEQRGSLKNLTSSQGDGEKDLSESEEKPSKKEAFFEAELTSQNRKESL